ncbi:MAG TPA: hypothetical protein VFX31_05090 [Ktedonobacterales bacterium]|nr:hypothetical protein [Ktedonobacterales bacterium]
MLAYVFWHWPRPGVAYDEYVARQLAFHQALAARGPTALEASYIWRVVGAPWTPASVTYEDWYLLGNSAGLDALNAAAVSDSLRETHDAAASLAAGGMAALYTPSGPRVGEQPALDGSVAYWFTKPDALRYSALYQRLRPQLAHLWTRMMVLGPSPEFLLLGDDLAALPPEWRPQLTHRERLWPLDDTLDDAAIHSGHES